MFAQNCLKQPNLLCFLTNKTFLVTFLNQNKNKPKIRWFLKVFCTKLDVRRAKESNFLAVRHFFNIHANLVTLQEIRIYISQKNSSLIQVLFESKAVSFYEDYTYLIFSLKHEWRSTKNLSTFRRIAKVYIWNSSVSIIRSFLWPSYLHFMAKWTFYWK